MKPRPTTQNVQRPKEALLYSVTSFDGSDNGHGCVHCHTVQETQLLSQLHVGLLSIWKRTTVPPSSKVTCCQSSDSCSSKKRHAIRTTQQQVISPTQSRRVGTSRARKLHKHQPMKQEPVRPFCISLEILVPVHYRTERAFSLHPSL